MPFLISDTKEIFGGSHVFVVAEIGKNFIQTEEDRSVEEYLKNAKRLVDAAVDAGCDAVKFQTHEIEDEFMRHITVVSPILTEAIAHGGLHAI